MEEMTLIEAYSFFEKEDDVFKKEMQVENLLVDIACEFINYRAKHGMTQKDLAQKLEMTQAMVSKLESGEYNPTIKMLFEIAQKLGWKFDLQFKSDIASDGYAFQMKEEQCKEYFENMGLAS